MTKSKYNSYLSFSVICDYVVYHDKGGSCVMADYEEYVKKYARDRGITEAEAESHALVKEVKHYYKEKESGKNERVS